MFIKYLPLLLSTFIFSQADCNSSINICEDTEFSGNSSGSGSTFDLNTSNNGCLFGEHQSSWYNFIVTADGTLSFLITPQNGTDDYDFALWESLTCPPTTQPLRCSYAFGSGSTGLVDGSGDNSENLFGDRYVEDLDVVIGDQFVLLVDNFSSSSSPFDLDWTGTAELACVNVNIDYVQLDAYSTNLGNQVKWYNQIPDTVFKSIDGSNWEVFSETDWSSKLDTDVEGYLNYYKLKNVIVAVDNRGPRIIKKVFNILGQQIDVDSRGLVIILYTNGDVEKVFRK